MSRVECMCKPLHFSEFSDDQKKEKVKDTLWYILRSFSVPTRTCGEILRRVNEVYSGKDRYFHNFSHIYEVLHYARAIVSNPSCRIPINENERTSFMLAVIFHDIVYNPKKDDNEESSIEFMQEILPLQYFPDEIVRIIIQAILATKHNDVIDNKQNMHIVSRIVHDADLAVLAKPWNVFMEDSKKIKREYNHLSEEEWQEGRTAFFASLLAKDSIFYTDSAQSLFESSTRANIANYVAIISKPNAYIDYRCNSCGHLINIKVGPPVCCEYCGNTMAPVNV